MSIVQQHLKQSSELMRSAFTQLINGENVNPQDLEMIEKHLNELPKTAWENLQNQTHIFRPVKSVSDLVHNLRTLVGIPGAMAWTSTKLIEYLSTPDEVLRNKPHRTLKEQVIDHNRYLLFPDTHSAFEAFLELGDLHTELTQRYEFLKQIVNSKLSH